MQSTSETVTGIRIAILDDYQQVALRFADWTTVREFASIDVYTDTLQDHELVKRLQPYTIICAMRERTKFPPAVLDRLPNLKFIATTGMRNAGIDVLYARSKGIVVSGTGGKDATIEHIWALIFATTRYVAAEDANIKNAKPQWQSTIPLHLSTRTLGLLGVGRLGKKTAAVRCVPSSIAPLRQLSNLLDREGPWYERRGVVPKSHQGASRGSWRRFCGDQRAAFP